MATVTEPVAVESGPSERLADITADEFFAMVEAGIFGRDRRVLLWRGRILEKLSKTVRQAVVSCLVAEGIRKRMGTDWLIWPENPLQLDQLHAPLPDIAVVRGSGPARTYRLSW
jgi:hypothetical protein